MLPRTNHYENDEAPSRPGTPLCWMRSFAALLRMTTERLALFSNLDRPFSSFDSRRTAISA